MDGQVKTVIPGFAAVLEEINKIDYLTFTFEGNYISRRVCNGKTTYSVCSYKKEGTLVEFTSSERFEWIQSHFTHERHTEEYHWYFEKSGRVGYIVEEEYEKYESIFHIARS
jgi:hypothetical protein